MIGVQGGGSTHTALDLEGCQTCEVEDSVPGRLLTVVDASRFPARKAARSWRVLHARILSRRMARPTGGGTKNLLMT